MSDGDISEDQRQHWSRKAEVYGGTPQAVGSESSSHKALRYRLIVDTIANLNGVSILDVGAGVGDFFGYLSAECPSADIQYTGLELTEALCAQGKEKYPGIDLRPRDIATESDLPSKSFDYVVMSGLFHQHGSIPKERWAAHMLFLLERGFALCRRGLAFNVLNRFADFERPGNFHVDTIGLQADISARMGRYFEVRNAYPLFETTFGVFRSEHVRSQYPEQSLHRYLREGSK